MSDSDARMWIVAVQGSWFPRIQTIGGAFLEPLLRFIAAIGDGGEIDAAVREWERVRDKVSS